MTALTVYTTPTCGPCIGVKANLKSRGIEFATVDLTEQPETLASLKERLGGVPKVSTPMFDFNGDLLDITGLPVILKALAA